MSELDFYYMPSDAFYDYFEPFSILLYPDKIFTCQNDDEKLTIFNKHNMWKTCSEITILFYCTRLSHRECENGCLHLSAVSCDSENFLDSTILSINIETGKWMLRKPYSEVYP